VSESESNIACCVSRSTVCTWKSGTVCEVRSVNAVLRVPVYSSRKKKMELNIIKRFREVRVVEA
jgi:hypothetical protein